MSIKDAGGGSSRPRAPQRRYIFGVLFAALCVICGFIIFLLGDFHAGSPARKTERTVAAPPMATPEPTDVSGPAVVGARLVIEPPGAPGPSGRKERLRWLESKSLQDWGKQNPLDASRWAIENLSPEECWRFLGSPEGIAFHLGAKDMQQGLLLFQNLKKWDGQKVPGIGRRVVESPEQGRSQITKLMQEFEAKVKAKASDPAKAIELKREYESLREHLENYRRLNEPKWEDLTIYYELMQEFAEGAVASDPAKAIELAREFGSLYELAGHWAELDVQQATQWARSLTDAKELDAVVQAITFELVHNNRDRSVMVDWVNSLVDRPATHAQAVTKMLQGLPLNELRPILEDLLIEPLPDAGLALALLHGIAYRGTTKNIDDEGPLRGQLLQQIASGLGEGLLNNKEVQLALGAAIHGAAKPMRGANRLNYLASGGGVIPEAQVEVADWSTDWQEWAAESPAEATGWLTETRPAKDQVAVVEKLRQWANREMVLSGGQGGEGFKVNYEIVMDNQGVFRLKVEPVGSEAAGQQFTYINGQWVPPLPEKWQREHIDTRIKERMNLRSALDTLNLP